MFVDALIQSEELEEQKKMACSAENEKHGNYWCVIMRNDNRKNLPDKN